MSNEQKRTNAPQELRMGPGGRRGPGGPMGMQNIEKAKDKKRTLKRFWRRKENRGSAFDSSHCYGDMFRLCTKTSK